MELIVIALTICAHVTVLATSTAPNITLLATKRQSSPTKKFNPCSETLNSNTSNDTHGDNEEKNSLTEIELLVKKLNKKYAALQHLLLVYPPKKVQKLLPVDVEFVHGRDSDFAEPILRSCFELTRTNMKDIYDNSKFQIYGVNHPGWDDLAKWNETKNQEAYYIILRRRLHGKRKSPVQLKKDANIATNTDAVGCCIVKFVPQAFDDSSVGVFLYIYEIQLDKKVQNRGIGFALMEYLKFLVKQMKINGIILAVQRANSQASAFYREKCGFEVLFYNDTFDAFIWDALNSPSRRKEKLMQ